MYSIQKSAKGVKEIGHMSGTFVPGGGDRATLESDLSTSPAHQGEMYHLGDPQLPSPIAAQLAGGHHFSYIPEVVRLPDGVNAKNSGGEAEGEGVSPLSGVPPIGFIYKGTNCDSDTTSQLQAILDDFLRYKYCLQSKPSIFLHLKHKEDSSEVLYRVDRQDGSRYFPAGRKKIQQKLHRRLSGSRQKGLLMTCTVAAGRYDKITAWRLMWPSFKKLMDSLNQHRKRRMGVKGRLRYIAVLEATENGYPHLHVFFPGLRYLIDDLAKLDSFWGLGDSGGVDVKASEQSQSARSYALKYIGKLEGWTDQCQAILWKFGIRLYNLSHCWFKAKELGEWVIESVYSTIKEMSEGLGLAIEDVYGVIDSDAKFVYVRSP